MGAGAQQLKRQSTLLENLAYQRQHLGFLEKCTR